MYVKRRKILSGIVAAVTIVLCCYFCWRALVHIFWISDFCWYPIIDGLQEEHFPYPAVLETMINLAWIQEIFGQLCCGWFIIGVLDNTVSNFGVKMLLVFLCYSVLLLLFQCFWWLGIKIVEPEYLTQMLGLKLEYFKTINSGIMCTIRVLILHILLLLRNLIGK